MKIPKHRYVLYPNQVSRLNSQLYRPSALLVSLMLITSVLLSAYSSLVSKASVSNTRADAWGTNEVSGSGWLGSQGVNVYSNGSTSAGPSPDTYNYVNNYNNVSKQSGIKWQCVELINRLYLTRGWITDTWTGNGDTLKDHVPVGLVFQSNGSLTYLNAGDVIVLSGVTNGHAGIINSVSGSTVQIVNQNTVDVYSSASYSSGTITMTGWSGYTVQGVIHSPVGGGQTGGGAENISNLALNGGFNSSANYWSPTGSANMVQYSSASGTNPYEGGGFIATNSSASGDSIYQQAPRNINSGDTYCLEAKVVTVGSSSGGGGVLTLWLIGGSSNNSSSYTFSSLPGNNGWTQIKTCVTATTTQYFIKAQIYPTVSGSTIGVDALDMHQSLSQNAGFNLSGYWATGGGGTNFTTYGSGGGTNTYEDSGYGVTNTTTAGGSIYQDRTLTIVAGSSFCVDALVVTPGSTSGAGGVLALWLLGTNSAEVSTSTFSNLPANSNWTPIKNCITAAAAHTSLRIQLYPTQNGPTVGLEVLDTHYARIYNSSFNSSASNWSSTGSANMVRYTSASGTNSFDDGGFLATNGTNSGDSVYQSVPIATTAGDTFCAETRVVTIGTTGGSGTLALWLTGGSSNESSSYNFSGLGMNNSWLPIKTCVTATISHTAVKIEVYPTPTGPTIGLDALDLH